MKLSKHVAPKYAAAFLNYNMSITSKANKQFYENLIKWNYLADCIQFWAYDQYFRDGGFMFAYNTFYQYKEFYKYMKENRVQWAYLEGQWNNKNSTGFNGLKGYLQSKIGWDVDIDMDYYIDKYFNAVYGSESKKMKEIFDEYIALLSRQTYDYNMSSVMGGTGFFKEELWPKNVVEEWYNKYKEIENSLLIKDNY